jgi:hypothetical protein
MPLTDQYAKALLSWGLWLPSPRQLLASAADPIKIKVLKALEAMLLEIPEFGSVRRWYDIPFDLNNLAAEEWPACFFWEEENRDLSNRLGWHTLDMFLAVFFQLDLAEPGLGQPDEAAYQVFNEQADKIVARIHAKLMVPAGLRAAGVVQVEEKLVQKALADFQRGELLFTFTLTYAHLAGDGFTKG